MRDTPLILIVDDEQDICDIFSTKLSAEGYQTACAKSKDECLKMAKDLQPDLILMDINIPGTSGTELTLLLKHFPSTESSKIVFLTGIKEPWPGFSGTHDEVARVLGANGFISKTDDLELIVKKIKEYLVDSPPPPPPPPPKPPAPPVGEPQAQ